MLPHSAPSETWPVLVLAGRTNVGKSTLFNRIVGTSAAVAHRSPGVTRDRLAAQAEWAGRVFTVVDTGGLGGAPSDPYAPAVAAQAEAALAEADCVLLVVDAASGLHPEDRRIAERVRRLGKPVVLIANKCDRRGASPQDFYALGLGEPLAVSASRGEGLGDALDAALSALRAPGGPPRGATVAATALMEDAANGALAAVQASRPVPVAVVGRPNVGKSSLINRLLGTERLIVSEVAGTTRDAVDIPWEAAGHRFLLVDTPGLRRPARIRRQELEYWSTRRSTRAIARADVVALVLDGREPCTEQDKRIAGLAVDRGRAVVIVLNKVDALAPDGVRRAEEAVRSGMPFLSYATLVACSARTGSGVHRLPAALALAAQAFRSRLQTAALNACVRDAVASRPPPAHHGRPVRIYYVAQVDLAPPTLVLLVSAPQGIPREYARYLEHQLRARFPLAGTPLRLIFRARPHRRLHVVATPGRTPHTPRGGRLGRSGT